MFQFYKTRKDLPLDVWEMMGKRKMCQDGSAVPTSTQTAAKR